MLLLVAKGAVSSPSFSDYSVASKNMVDDKDKLLTLEYALVTVIARPLMYLGILCILHFALNF